MAKKAKKMGILPREKTPEKEISFFIFGSGAVGYRHFLNGIACA